MGHGPQRAVGPFLSPRPDTQLEVPPLEMTSLGGWLVTGICDTGGHGVVYPPSGGLPSGGQRTLTGKVGVCEKLAAQFAGETFWVTQGFGTWALLSFSARAWPITPWLCC